MVVSSTPIHQGCLPQPVSKVCSHRIANILLVAAPILLGLGVAGGALAHRGISAAVVSGVTATIFAGVTSCVVFGTVQCDQCWGDTGIDRVEWRR